MVGFIGLGLLIVGIVAIIFGLIARKKAALISNTPTTRTDKISTAGFYEVKGKVRCDQPLSVPNWDVLCVWYHFKVEEKIQYRDDGRTKTRWRTVDEKTQGRPFQVEDRGGTIWVNPDGAAVDGTKKDYDQHQAPGFLSSLFGTRQTVGQRITVNYLEVGASAYVLGRVTRNQRGLSFVSGGEAFIISNKSEEQVLGSEETTTYIAIGGGIVSLIASCICILTWLRGN